MPSPSSRRALAALGVAVALTSGCDLVTGAAPAPVTGPPGSALETLATVDVRGRGPRTGYERDEFGDGWVDTDRNGCDTRNDVLARDLTGETFVSGSRDCVVATGTLDDPYSGRTIAFRRGEGTSEAVQIDHVVALSDAWQKGARQWDDARRTQFANDPLNLLAVDGPLNMQKGDGDAATWLPPDRSYRCAYVARQVAVKATYGLWVTRAERDAMAAVLGTCPGEPLPGGEPLPAQETPQGPFPDCAAARAAGAAPLREGEPGWNPDLDGDGDGVGCES
ncbi:HNH endonuclease family protein [Geodermatophilus nigrescens]|uniref:Excalibur calcium-binding domain-containing protein n=1 Tax=Geodermatophilus nigrescens TaxID=1070870 RepID=A0A1M5NCX6_9ACTN|nr:HNH endonuclease family protein [Geodermatophilus nigrescens]SHG87466.1 Excalibur calcium-binding domain-containing protein [Geodermatophilus nigrescens]